MSSGADAAPSTGLGLQLSVCGTELALLQAHNENTRSSVQQHQLPAGSLTWPRAQMTNRSSDPHTNRIPPPTLRTTSDRPCQLWPFPQSFTSPAWHDINEKKGTITGSYTLVLDSLQQLWSHQKAETSGSNSILCYFFKLFSSSLPLWLKRPHQHFHTFTGICEHEHTEDWRDQMPHLCSYRTSKWHKSL